MREFNLSINNKEDLILKIQYIVVNKIIYQLVEIEKL